jgi:two-component system probable response regulator PhcQ
MNPLLSPHHILYVDDEERALHYFRQCFEDEYVIHTATNAADGYKLLETHGARIGMLLTDQRMPGESGVELMDRARRLQPNVIRILVTAYTDYESAVKAVNEGRAWRYLHKPIGPEMLGEVLKEGLEAYQALLDRDKFLREKAGDLRTQLMTDKVMGMGIMAEGLNHHIRNALTVVRAFIDLAPMKLMEEIDARYPKDPSFWIEMQGQAQSQIDRIQSLLTNLAHASYAKKLKREDELDLLAELEETRAQHLQHLKDKKIRIDLQINPDVPLLLVHGERFRQMLRLLFIEEITHLHEGDFVQIKARLEKDTQGDEFVIIELADNGAWGGPQDVAANLFDPFYTRSRKPDDFGVNMMACYVTLHLHGGSVTARRLEPGGMEMVMRMPLDPNKNTKEAEDFLRRSMSHDEEWGKLSELAA